MAEDHQFEGLRRDLDLQHDYDTLRQALAALVAQWRQEADELDAATGGTWIEPGITRSCADQLEALLAGPPQE